MSIEHPKTMMDLLYDAKEISDEALKLQDDRQGHSLIGIRNELRSNCERTLDGIRRMDGSDPGFVNVDSTMLAILSMLYITVIHSDWSVDGERPLRPLFGDVVADNLSDILKGKDEHGYYPNMYANIILYVYGEIQ